MHGKWWLTANISKPCFTDEFGLTLGLRALSSIKGQHLALLQKRAFWGCLMSWVLALSAWSRQLFQLRRAVDLFALHTFVTLRHWPYRRKLPFPVLCAWFAHELLKVNCGADEGGCCVCFFSCIMLRFFPIGLENFSSCYDCCGPSDVQGCTVTASSITKKFGNLKQGNICVSKL